MGAMSTTAVVDQVNIPVDQLNIPTTKSLKGKVALVTGAGRGIGRAIAIALASQGATVAINYRTSAENAASLRDALQEADMDCLLVQGDVSDQEDARRVVKHVLDSPLKRLDILINNAGVTRDKSMAKMGSDEWDHVINTNLNSNFYCTSAVLPAMIEQKYGRIVSISSVVGQAGAFGQANYAASKGAIIAFTKSLALEVAKHNITANTIAPGYTDTDMFAGVSPEIREKIRGRIPLGRFGQPEEIAAAVAFLVTQGDYITGQQININGGCYM
jgi:acetoacetyl-CoA reductase